MTVGQSVMDPPAFPTPVPLPSQLHNIPVVTYFYPEIEIHLHVGCYALALVSTTLRYRLFVFL